MVLNRYIGAKADIITRNNDDLILRPTIPVGIGRALRLKSAIDGFLDQRGE